MQDSFGFSDAWMSVSRIWDFGWFLGGLDLDFSRIRILSCSLGFLDLLAFQSLDRFGFLSDWISIVSDTKM
jgi:hypothetical protein